MKKWYADPLVIFLLLGAVIFLIDRTSGGFGEDSASLIEITPALHKRLADQWQAQMGRPASAEETRSLLEQWIREEIYYREAMALGLDRNDTIIRRRLAQKLNFLTEDMADAAEPTTDELNQYFEAHAERFREPARFGFEHRYFSADRREDAQADAQAALQDESQAGDPFILQKSYAGRSEREIADLFGRSFAEALEPLLPVSDAWQGPVQSAYGWHLVRLTQYSPTHVPEFGSVAEKVLEEMRLERRREANEALFADLRAKYRIRDLTDSSGR